MNITKIVIITGASRGLGLETANMFTVIEGWKVIGIGTSARPAKLKGNVDYHQFNAGDADECRVFWQFVKTHYPNIPVTLINNAGGYIAGSLREVDRGAYQKQMDANFFPAVHMTRTLADMVDSARIITIISATAHEPTSKNTAYGASKAAEKYFFQALQKELKPSQFKMTNIYPDSIATKGADPKAMDPQDLARFICSVAEFKSTYYIRDITLSTDS
jgi:NAD(P)-dependent dehydrogenase (short-subunit alcohol dehydrogenase family)